jgi:hypothetical protein
MSYFRGYKVHLDNPHERIRVGRAMTPTGAACAVAYRFERELTRFLVTPAQIKKIKKGRGVITISPKMIDKHDLWCKR